MAGTRSIFLAILVVVVILVGSAVGLLYLNPSSSGGSKVSSTTIASTTAPTLNGTSNVPATSATFQSVSSSSSSSSSITTSSTNAEPNYSLELVQAGQQPIVTSNLTTPLSKTQFRADGLGGDCGGAKCYTLNYTNGGYSWTVQGDFEPGTSYVNANSSGMTLSDQTCSAPNIGNPLRNCGPYWEWNGDTRFVNGKLTGEENTSELSSALYNVPSSAQLFSIYLTLPKYNFMGCDYNVSSSGCSYEGYVPSISGVWALDVGSSNSSDSYSLAVSLSESCSALSHTYGSCVSSTNVVSVGISTAAFVNGAYDSSLSKNLAPNVPTLPYNSSASTYRISIASDLRTYLEVWVGSILEYSSSTVPIPIGDTYALNFYQFDNVDNMTLSTTWKNMTVYSSPGIVVTGLSSGMSFLASDQSGYNASAAPDTNGTARLAIPSGFSNLTISVEQNGVEVANFTGAIGIGAEFKLVVA